MKVKQIAVWTIASCMTLFLCSCGTSSDNSAVQSSDWPTMEQIYEANTLQAYENAQIQPSLSTCIRQGEENKETNALLTVYHDDQLGLISRTRAEDMRFQYYFNKDGTDFYCQQDKEEAVSLVILSDAFTEVAGDLSYPEYLFDQNSFGTYHVEETILSCTDSGDTYHIVTDISALSHMDDDGQKYTYATQEYDVEKDTLRILATFRTYQLTDTNGVTEECTFSRCMTYNRQLISLPKFILEDINGTQWNREIVLASSAGTKTVSVPNHIPVSIEVPNGYAVYADSSYTQAYRGDRLEVDGTYPNRTVYIAEE